MKTIIKLKIYALAFVFSLSACGGGGGSSPEGGDSSTTKTTYNITLDNVTQPTAGAPAPAAIAVTTDITSNFKVAIVSADGIVQETLTPESITQQTNGSFDLVLAGGLRLDCVIVFNESTAPIITVGETLPLDALLAPTVSLSLSLDFVTTESYLELLRLIPDNLNLQTGSGYTEAQIQQVFTQVKDTYYDASSNQTPDQIISLTKRELEIVSQGDTTYALASLYNSGGYLNELSGFDPVDLSWTSYRELQSTGTLEYSWNTQTLAFEATDLTATPPSDLVLTSAGWQAFTDTFSISANGDGSVTSSFINAPEIAYKAEAIYQLDISNKPMHDYLIEGDVLAWSTIIPAGTNFTQGSELYRVEITPVSDIALFEFNAGSQIVDTDSVPVASLAQMQSATAATSTNVANMNLVLFDFGLAAEFVEGGLVNFFIIDSTTNETTLIDTGTWSARVLHGQTFYTIDSSEIFNGITDNRFTLALTAFEGVVYVGAILQAGQAWASELYFNDVAKTNVVDAFNASASVTTPPLPQTVKQLLGGWESACVPDQLTKGGTIFSYNISPGTIELWVSEFSDVNCSVFISSFSPVTLTSTYLNDTVTTTGETVAVFEMTDNADPSVVLTGGFYVLNDEMWEVPETAAGSGIFEVETAASYTRVAL